MRCLPSLICMSAVFLAIAIPGARSADLGSVKPAICGTRSTCTVAKVTPAGMSAAGAALAVAEIHLGLADAPDPQNGCHTGGDADDGGQEYGLTEGRAAPRLLLKLCNDGYGAAGVGEDEVTIDDNRLSHFQAGGSNDRWEVTDTVRLSPPGVAADR